VTRRGRAVKEVSFQGDQPQGQSSLQRKGVRWRSTAPWAGWPEVPAKPISAVSPENAAASLCEWELPSSLTRQKLFLKGWMTSVRRQFKTSQGSEKGRKKKKKKKKSAQPGLVNCWLTKQRGGTLNAECRTAKQPRRQQSSGDFQGHALLWKSSCLCYSERTPSLSTFLRHTPLAIELFFSIKSQRNYLKITFLLLPRGNVNREAKGTWRLSRKSFPLYRKKKTKKQNKQKKKKKNQAMLYLCRYVNWPLEIPQSIKVAGLLEWGAAGVFKLRNRM
jgi:hypothetical protein